MLRAVVLTALEVEYCAVRAHLTDLSEEMHERGTVYELGRFEANGRPWDVALVQVGMGNPRAAQETERAITHFDPSIALFVGVASGLKDVRLGDVVAATKVYGYEFGKAAEEMQPRPEVSQSTYRMVQRAQAVARNDNWQDRILPEPSEPKPKMLVTPLAAGSKVVASNQSSVFAFLRANHSDASAVEMEGHGFLSAVYANTHVEALVIRGISDLIEGKSDADAEGWQERASRHAAAVAFEVLGTLGSPEASIAAHVSAFESVERFFHPFLDPAKVFNHTYPLIGRDLYPDQLKQFVSSTQRVAVLRGRGGIGKSKILKEALTQIEAMDKAPHVLLVGGFDRLPVNELPAGRILLAVDDLHRLKENERRALLSLVRSQADRMQLILTTWPSEVRSIRQSLMEHRFTPDELLNLPELAPLSRREMVALATEVLGEAYAHLAEHLVDITGDSLLVTVVAARLFVLEQIDPTQLIDAEQSQSYIFDRFTDVLVGHLSAEIDPELARSTLDLVSAIGPFRAHFAPLVERAAAFLGIEVDQFHRLLSALAEAGALVSVNESYRVTPDLLSRFILKKAAVTPAGESNGFADRVFERFADLAADEFLSSLVDFLPEEVLRFIRSLIKQGDIEIREVSLEEALRGIPANPYRKVPSILHRLCFVQRLCPVALDLLWDLRHIDKRASHNNPDHPTRVLQDLAAIQTDAETWLYDAILDAVERWSADPDAFTHPFSPLDVLNELLKHRVTAYRVDGERFEWCEQSVSSVRYREVRRRAIRILTRLSRRDAPALQYRALRSLIDSVWAPDEVDTAIVEETEARARTSENDLIFTAIRALLGRTESRLLACAVEQKLRWMVRKAHSSTAASAYRQLLKALPSDVESKIVRYLWLGWAQFEFFAEIENYEQREAAINHEIGEIVQHLDNCESSAESMKTRLERELRSIAQYGIDVSPGYLLLTLAEQHSDLTPKLSALIVTNPDSLLTRHLRALLLPLAASDRAEYIRVVGAALNSTDTNLWTEVASTLGNIGPLREAEREVVRRLAVRCDPALAGKVLSSLRRFPPEAIAEVDAVAAKVDIGSDLDIADALCEVYLERAKAAILSQDLWRSLLHKLVLIPDIPTGSPTHNLIDVLVQTNPMLAVEFFVERISHEIVETGRAGERYLPVPFPRFTKFSASKANPEARRDALTRITHLMIEPEGLSRYWLSKLFAILAGEFDDVGLEVVEKLIAEEGRYGVQHASLLLKEAPSGFVFARATFVARLLGAAQAAGPDVLECVWVQLMAGASSGTEMVRPGEPPPQFSSLKQRAEAAAAEQTSEGLIRVFYEDLAKEESA